MSTDFRAELQRLVEAIKNWDFDTGSLEQDWSALDRACAALAQPEPVAPTDEELRAFYDSEDNDEYEWPWWHRIFRVLLTRYARPTIQPVPVSERLPGNDECRPNPRTGAGYWCWGFIQHDPYSFAGRWRMMKREWLIDEADFWLPHWALPMPANTTKEEN